MQESQPETLSGLLRRADRRWPDQIAASFPDRDLTYREVWARSCAFADHLSELGVARRDHIGFLMPNCPELLVGMMGATLLGAVPVPVNARFRSDELPYVLADSDILALVTLGATRVTRSGDSVDYLARLEAALPGLASSGPRLRLPQVPRLRRIVAFDPDGPRPWVTAAAFEAGAAPAGTRRSLPVTDPEDTALMLYTSGTTSRPKGVLISHRALVSTCTRGARDKLHLRAGEAIWNPAPMYHVSAYVAIVGAIGLGGTYVTAGHFDPAEAFDHLSRIRPRIAFANFPAFYLGLHKEMASRGIRDDLGFRLLTTAGSPPEVERIRSLFPSARQISVTGSTELSGTICANDLDDTPVQRAETAGRPIAGVTLSVRDPETLEVLPAGEKGELWVSGQCLFTGYYRQKEPPFVAEQGRQWFRTGDLAVLHADGRLSYAGRLKDMLKVGGENVSAAEIEAFLMRHPAIEMAQIVSLPDERLGEVPAAFISIRPGAQLSADEVVGYCRGGLATFKLPRLVRFVTDWPMSATKIQKHQLREALLSELSGSPEGSRHPQAAVL